MNDTDCRACVNKLQRQVLVVLNMLEQELAKACVPDVAGIVTNHMHAAWHARDAINDIFDEAEFGPYSVPEPITVEPT
jgi:hypothetical protein